jgi:hypothetical protein
VLGYARPLKELAPFTSSAGNLTNTELVTRVVPLAKNEVKLPDKGPAGQAHQRLDTANEEVNESLSIPMAEISDRPDTICLTAEAVTHALWTRVFNGLRTGHKLLTRIYFVLPSVE